MAKTNTIKKLVNGEIADADDVNQIAENVGSEGGSIPYDENTQDRDTTGSESLGSASYPWGNINLNELGSFNEIATGSQSVSATVLVQNLRKFISQKDTPSTYSGQATKLCAVNSGETAIEFVSGDYLAAELFTSNGTFNVPAGVTQVWVTGCGGGGGGGGRDGTPGGGGGGGASYRRVGMQVTPSSSITITVGTAGTGGAASGGNGTAGGDTIFNVGNTDGYDMLTMDGGGGGLSGSTGGAGGTAGTHASSGLDGNASGGGEAVPGVGSRLFFGVSGGDGGDSGGSNYGGSSGGSSLFGRGGNGNGSTPTTVVPLGFGAGGGGGSGSGSGTAQDGNNGTAGFCLIEYQRP